MGRTLPEHLLGVDPGRIIGEVLVEEDGAQRLPFGDRSDQSGRNLSLSLYLYLYGSTHFSHQKCYFIEVV
jgi:hypothetical protein